MRPDTSSDLELASAYLDQELSAKEAQAFEARLSSEPGLAALVQELRDDQALWLEACPPPEVPRPELARAHELVLASLRSRPRGWLETLRDLLVSPPSLGTLAVLTSLWFLVSPAPAPKVSRVLTLGPTQARTLAESPTPKPSPGEPPVSEVGKPVAPESQGQSSNFEPLSTHVQLAKVTNPNSLVRTTRLLELDVDVIWIHP